MSIDHALDARWVKMLKTSYNRNADIGIIKKRGFEIIRLKIAIHSRIFVENLAFL